MPLAGSRRALLAGALVAALPRGARAAQIDPDELLRPGPLEDLWLGPPEAKVTVIEYASLTCSHCAHFHKATFGELRKRFIDTGRMRFTLRPFPLDPLSTLAFMMARSEPARYYELTGLLFETQESWAFADKPVDALRQRLLSAGFTQESFDRVLHDQALLDGVNAVKERGIDAFGVKATPTFFINGQRRQGAISIEDFETIIGPLPGP
ncbi:DsbA family protein [Enterovirga sp.]|uniref:DsbA family protein n=1 Tax=Enterovirga sp. TaxID=2026350 RepID=UPI002D187F74|nr:DsbA family protein [Enterovirga sp.]HMO29344.1 DsbA family protein [Enterovirga sp.]